MTPAPLDLTLFTAQATWQAPPLVQVKPQLWGPLGRKAQATAYANADGRVTVQFRTPGLPGDPKVIVIEAGDRLELRPLTGLPLTLTLPMLSADLDPAGRSVEPASGRPAAG